MNIQVVARQLGKKRALIEKKIELEEISSNPSVSDLICAVVKHQVDVYNQQPNEKSLLPVLSKENITAQSETGKVGFGIVQNEKKADVLTAQETALQAFEDGMFAIFAEDVELTKLDQVFELKEATQIIFIRLTFLAGSYW